MESMDSDFRPSKRPAESGQNKPYIFPETKQPTTVETDRSLAPDEDEDMELVSDGEAVTEEQPQPTGESPEAIREQAATPAEEPAASGWRQKLKLSWPPGKKEWSVIAVVVLLGLAGGLFIATRHHAKNPAPHAVKQVIKPQAPSTVASNLSGLQVDPSLNKLPVTGVMIENSTEARPQSGLGQAMVVFEAVAEGGITRFLALYQDTSPSSVGPIRSARPYYIQWALGFDAGYAHVGGSPDALIDLKGWNARDLDQFANSAYYQRISSRQAPHNVYTSIARLNQLEDSKGYTSSNFTGFPRKADAAVKQPTAGSINLTLSGAAYNVHYDYVAATNTYNRSEGGAPQIDANTNTQISPRVVVAMVIPESNGALDSSGAYYSDYASIGSGPVYVFQDGTVTTGTWTKSTNGSQITFANGAGQPIKFNAGQTWLTAVSSTGKVSYTP